MKKNKYDVLCLIALFTLTTLVSSCKKYFDPPLVFEKEEPQVITKDRKVLLISIDGLSGLELKKYTPSNMAGLLEHAKYTFDALASGDTGDAATWATMMSSKSTTATGIYGNTFEEESDDNDDPDHNGSDVSTGFISVFQRMMETGKGLQSMTATPWDLLDKNLFGLADKRIVKTDDATLKDDAVEAIKNGEEKEVLSIVNFRELNKAGLNGGFSMDNADYKSTLERMDGYVGELLNAVEERKRYSNEEWLVIITSNHGGVGNEYGGGTMEERKVPLIFYNTNLTKLQIDPPQIVNTLTMKKAGNDIPIMKEDPNAYEVGSSGEFTIISKVKVSAFPGTNSILYGKTSHAYSGTKGWHLMVEGTGKRFRYIMGNGTLIYIYAPGQLTIDQWHNVALRIYNENGKRMAACYMDGIAGEPVDITGKDLTAGSANPLFIGPGPSGKSYGEATAIISNLAFYNTALSNDDINAFKCKDDIASTENTYANLKGFWKIDEGAGQELKNTIPTNTNTNFLASTSLGWGVQPKWNCFTSEQLAEEETKQLIYQQDILSQIYYWLNIKVETSWNLEGKEILKKYETEFVGK